MTREKPPREALMTPVGTPKPTLFGWLKMLSFGDEKMWRLKAFSISILRKNVVPSVSGVFLRMLKSSLM